MKTMFGGELWAWALLAEHKLTKQQVAKSSDRSASERRS